MKYPSNISFYKIAQLYVICGSHSWGSGSSNNTGWIGSHRSRSNSNTSTRTSSRVCCSSSSRGKSREDNPRESGRASFVCADSTAEEFNLFCAVFTILC